jgi:hypothetical protein
MEEYGPPRCASTPRSSPGIDQLAAAVARSGAHTGRRHVSRVTERGFEARTTCTACRKRVYLCWTITYHYPNRPAEVFCTPCSNRLFQTALLVPDRRGNAMAPQGRKSKNGCRDAIAERVVLQVHPAENGRLRPNITHNAN